MTHFITILLALLFSMPALAADYPHEPSGASVMIHNPMSTIPGPGCQDVYPGADGQIVSDGGRNVLRQRKNPVTGIGGHVYYCQFAATTKVYLSLWFKSNPDFYGVSSSQNKLIGYIAQQSGNHLRVDLLGLNTNMAPFVAINVQPSNPVDNCHLCGQGFFCAHAGECTFVGRWAPNLDGSGISRGDWHQLELILEIGGNRQSRVSWWIDQKPKGHYANANLPQSPFVAWALTHTWDGGGCAGGMQNCGHPPYPTTDFWYLRDMHLSAFGPSAPPPIQPPPPPGPAVTSVLTDDDGATVSIRGEAAKLRYFDDLTPKTELPDYVAKSPTYRLVKRWPVGTTFTCVQTQTAEGVWTEHQCNLVVPGVIIPPPAERCQDGLDNDGDGKVDFPADPGCTDKFDNDETDIDIPPPTSVFSDVVVGPTSLTFTYQAKDCHNVNRKTTGKETKTITLTCANESQLKKKEETAMMTRSYLWFDKRLDYTRHGYMCLNCGQPLQHEFAYSHAMYTCPKRKELLCLSDLPSGS